jgi:hypothetical protein
MLTPISALLEAVDGELPRELVSQRARKALRRRAARVPSAWFAGCVECRLDGRSDQNDLLVYATRDAGGQRHLASVLARAHGAQFGRTLPLLRSWAGRRSLLGRELANLWLEYDLPPDGSQPDPFAFICLYPDYLRRGYPEHVFGPPLAASRTRRVAAAGLRAVLGRAPDPRALDLVEHCAAALPMHGRMFHVVAMPQRKTSDLRVGAILPTRALRAWLAAVGWPGEQRDLGILERLIGGGMELVHAQIELGDGVRPRVAIDFESLVPAAESRRWHAFVERLTKAGCCERELALAAVNWLKSRPVRLPGENLPLRMDQQLFFKVTSSPDGLEAKAYLLFQPRHALL